MRIKLLMAAGAGLALATSMGAMAQEAKTEAPAFDDKIVCRKIKETGSLIRRKKLCFTQEQWDRLAETEQKGVRRVQDELSARPGGM